MFFGDHSLYCSCLFSDCHKWEVIMLIGRYSSLHQEGCCARRTDTEKAATGENALYVYFVFLRWLLSKPLSSTLWPLVEACFCGSALIETLLHLVHFSSSWEEGKVEQDNRMELELSSMQIKSGPWLDNSPSLWLELITQWRKAVPGLD